MINAKHNSVAWALLVRGLLAFFLVGPALADNGRQRCEKCSPGSWPTVELAKFTDLQWRLGFRPGNLQTEIKGADAKGIIVGTTEPLAIHIGLKAIEDGGTAADAVVASSLAQIALSAGSAVSYAGIFDAVYFDASTGKVHSLNAGFNTLIGDKAPSTIPESGPSGRTALVPGYMAGIDAMHRRFGRLAFADLVAPSIWIAENGVAMNRVVHGEMTTHWSVLSRLEETRHVFSREDGQPYRLGDRFRQPALAQTLKGVAKEGAAYMYTGAWAKKLVSTIQREGGYMTLEDLASYRAEWREPTGISYGDVNVFSSADEQPGALITLGSLKTAEAARLRELGHYTTSADALFELIQISRVHSNFALAKDRLRVPGVDPRPGDQISAEMAKRIIAEIRRSPAPQQAIPESDSHTTVVVVADKEGNVAALVHSINSVAWGTSGIFVDGVSIPDSARFQQDAISAVGAGQRLPTVTVPLIAVKNGRPIIACGAIGTGPRLIFAKLLNMLEFGYDLAAANRQPYVLGTRAVSSNFAEVPAIVDRRAFSPIVIDDLRKLGQPVELSTDRSPRGYWAAVSIDPVTRELQGAVSRGLPSSIELLH